ncbi:MAG: hypothetical protein R3C26_24880 [Calditrichia bacterium]
MGMFVNLIILNVKEEKIEKISGLFLCCLRLLPACQTNPSVIGEPQYRDFESFEALSEYLRWQPESTPLASAHREPRCLGFPKNCIETFEKVSSVHTLALGNVRCP